MTHNASSALSAQRLMTRPSRHTICRRESLLLPSGGVSSETNDEDRTLRKLDLHWMMQVEITLTFTRISVADVDAVHLHVDLILHVPPLLVIVEDQTSI